MSTNAEDRPRVSAHSEYFEPESEALENIARVVRGDYEEVDRHRPSFPEIAGGLVSWFLRIPTVPARLAGRHYRGPGFRVLTNVVRLVDVGASETGNLVYEVLDEGERALLWFARHVGAVRNGRADPVYDEGARVDDVAENLGVEDEAEVTTPERPATETAPAPDDAREAPDSPEDEF